MLFQNITILNQDLEPLENRYVGIKGSWIDYIGTNPPKADYGPTYDGTGKVLMSGFVNSHAHTPMTLMRGYGENMALQNWLSDRIFPFEAQLTAQDVYYSTLLGIAESIRFGIVSTTDMYYYCDRMAEAILESGAKNNIGRGVTCFTDQDFSALPSYGESLELFRNYHMAGDGRVKIDLSLHAEYTSTPKVARQLGELAKELDAQIHVHISETKQEHEDCKERHGGKTPVAYLDSLGLLEQKTTAAHCVHVEGEDFDILHDKGVTVSTCPISNLKLASGVCQVPKLLDRGINVAIGTDSVASNNSLNFIEEVKFFSLLHKERYGDPTLISPKQALYAATRAGALGQGRPDTGLLAEGYRADLIVIDATEPHMWPSFDVRNNLVYSASGSDVCLTMVDGKVLYQDGEYLTIDLERVKWETRKTIDRILSTMKQTR